MAPLDQRHQEHAQWAPSGRPDLAAFVPRERRVAPLLLWLGSLAAALALLVWLGDGRLAAPDLTAPGAWGQWAAERGPVDTTIAVLRIVALGLAWYLTGITAVSVLAHAARAARLVRVADALALGPVRTVVQQALGVSLAVGVVASALPASAWGTADAVTPAPVASTVEVEADDPVVAVALDPDVAASPLGSLATDADADTPAEDVTFSPTPTPSPSAPDAPVVAVPIPAPGPAPVPTAAPPSAPPAVAPETLEATPTPAPAPVADGTAAEDTAAGDQDEQETRSGPREHRVVAGDHLWGIAEDDVAASLGRAPTEAEVHAQWERVVIANADRMPVPGNPDILHPGQQVVLPDVEVAP